MVPLLTSSGDVEPVCEACDFGSVPRAEVEHAVAWAKAGSQVIEEALPRISLDPRHPLAEAIGKLVVPRPNDPLPLIERHGSSSGSDAVIVIAESRYS